MILLANSTPIVCDVRTLHSFLTKRCSKHDLDCKSGPVNRQTSKMIDSLPTPARTQQNDFCEVIVHASQFLQVHQYYSLWWFAKPTWFAAPCDSSLAADDRLGRTISSRIAVVCAGEVSSHKVLLLLCFPSSFIHVMRDMISR
jgi:hypothetical protein